jgi:hypothetical protein
MKLEPLMTLHVEVSPVVSAGETPAGEVRLIPFTGGSFEGPGLRGKLLPGGSDWQRVRTDGVLEIRAHYMLETEQGERIEVISEGLRDAAPTVLDRLMRGEAVRPDEYYFRTYIRLNTASKRLDHLNRTLFVSSGERMKSAVRLTLYSVP